MTAIDRRIPRSLRGEIPARGVSAAQFGLRVNDASGNPIYDSSGLIDTLTVLGISAQNPAQTITSTSWTTLTPSIAVSFSLSRTSRVKLTAFVSAHSNTNSKLAYARINLVGVGTTGAAKWGAGATTSQDTSNAEFMLWCAPGSTVGSLAAGSYTAQVEAQVDVGGSMFFDQAYLVAELLGH